MVTAPMKVKKIMTAIKSKARADIKEKSIKTILFIAAISGFIVIFSILFFWDQYFK